MRSSPQGDAFPLTRHSVVLSAQSADPRERALALEAITGGYWRPVYKYVRMRWGMDREDAQDFAQDFFARLLEKDFLESYDPGKGRLRTFLRTCVDRMYMNRSRDSMRAKRGGAAQHLSLDFDSAEQELALVSGQPSPDDFFEKEWLRTLFVIAVERLREQCLAEQTPLYFTLFERYDLNEADERPTYGQLAQEFGLKQTEVTNYLAAARREFRRCLLDQLRAMTGSEEEFRREAQALFGERSK